MGNICYRSAKYISKNIFLLFTWSTNIQQKDEEKNTIKYSSLQGFKKEDRYLR